MGITRRHMVKGIVAASAVSQLAGATESRARGFNLGIITDELTENLGEALDFISGYGLRWCEVRDMWGKNTRATWARAGNWGGCSGGWTERLCAAYGTAATHRCSGRLRFLMATGR